ncbi:uncharacterized protein LOC119083627 [Bradysia coprophila]|uniref:uncharacterized protein LOC119083627 n=1 Tax=Bradysia coprophila TaxID=38358 RepID=UPI00187DD855|nr:uncharacterized protein LOC119083627 [Bradysia coprophila]
MQASSATTTRFRYVLDFWFGKPSDADYLKSKSFWYGDDAADNHVRQHLSDDYEKAKCGQYNDWSDSADGALALVILLDQVPRNIFRNTAQAYATDDKALEIAKKIVASGWDEHQPDIVRRYMYSPFNHSENLEDQRRSVELFTKLGDREHLHWAKNFYETIKTYGRFPHRDGILGRRPSS